ncbi:SDR family oxidoreductase [Polynucleobacter sp. 30F-ANTBAC]|jgi:NAD(P)-dependent dehydrogenase (short-subunit alcohol dehydrogenase family)|uniref:SDR family NAD(P)-dependent oxidoreductase n=1 Tax=Polynucleobacter sp. 30F-ANTBAC TaxID=2689095 RepID=UPI001C0BC790|nr:SDR family NAD(P)-dependent oxidoreductase [Polynucleobacter sp. 30F-ANTBAC]MBU3600432.1 SDR family oxidoreductase [Polynucleobacter sp. 30F-ANTBAC]
MRFSNKVVVVTGAGQGMGRAIAQTFAKEGASVIAVDINLDAATETIASGGAGKSMARALNVGDSAAVKKLFAEIDETYGKVDVLVNNAGIGSSKNDGFDKLMSRLAERGAQMAKGEAPTVYPDLIIDMEDEGWHGVLNVNLHGAFYFTREAVRLMVKSSTKGAIVNISSTSAMSGEGGLHYVTSKAALHGMAKSLARELGPRGIRVNNVVPGPTNTPMMQSVGQDWINSMIAAIPLGRMAEPQDIANVVCFVASDEAAMITGQDIVANGGSYFK